MGVVAWQMSHTTTSLSLGMVRIEPHSPQKCTLRACVWKTRFQLCCTLIVPVLGLSLHARGLWVVGGQVGGKTTHRLHRFSHSHDKQKERKKEKGKINTDARMTSSI